MSVAEQKLEWLRRYAGDHPNAKISNVLSKLEGIDRLAELRIGIDFEARAKALVDRFDNYDAYQDIGYGRRAGDVRNG